MNADIKIDWVELIKSYDQISTEIGDEVDGTNLLKAILETMVESSVSEADIRDPYYVALIKVAYYRSQGGMETKETIMDSYLDMVGDVMADFDIPKEDEEDFTKVLSTVIEGALENDLFRVRFSRPSVVQKLMTRAAEMYKSAMEVKQILGN